MENKSTVGNGSCKISWTIIIGPLAMSRVQRHIIEDKFRQIYQEINAEDFLNINLVSKEYLNGYWIVQIKNT